mmetsp:Transcript_118999/g.253822  ORF Transcript_118999/g.253822 Transcript_118999/m.253822 type:complete len:233 (-) Transcript_118999:795-1493(-)
MSELLLNRLHHLALLLEHLFCLAHADHHVDGSGWLLKPEATTQELSKVDAAAVGSIEQLEKDFHMVGGHTDGGEIIQHLWVAELSLDLAKTNAARGVQIQRLEDLPGLVHLVNFFDVVICCDCILNEDTCHDIHDCKDSESSPKHKADPTQRPHMVDERDRKIIPIDTSCEALEHRKGASWHCPIPLGEISKALTFRAQTDPGSESELRKVDADNVNHERNKYDYPIERSQG